MEIYANNFLKLIASQKQQGTLYCAGLDVHAFGKPGQTLKEKLDANLSVYGAFTDGADIQSLRKVYRSVAMYLPGLKDTEPLINIVTNVEVYLSKVIDVMVLNCGIRVFKPQSAFYEQFGPIGLVLLARVRNYITTLENDLNEPITVLLDCKRGDISTTQEAYFTALLGGLSDSWGVEYKPFDFDIINVTPWMGSDVMGLKNDSGSAGLGLKLMKEGKGLIIVNKSSNPSGPEYQELTTERILTVQMSNVYDAYQMNLDYELETDGISTIGLVVGSTHQCDGSIREAFPSTTLLVPGFGAQGGKFGLIMPELIAGGKHEGFGAIFSSSRGSMFPFLPKLGGSGNVANLAEDMKAAVSNFRKNEKLAYEEFGIKYPF